MTAACAAWLILNPSAGGGSAAARLDEISGALADIAGPLYVVVTEHESEVADAARRAVLNGAAHLFVAGGDGTLNEAINGVASVPEGFEQITFGVVPAGTGNDFATTLDIPTDISAALATLADRRVLRVDAGRVAGRWFVNVSAGGFIAEVSDAATEDLKSIAGRLAYVIAGARVMLDYTPVRMCWQVGEALSPAREEEIHLFAVCNARMAGGGRLIAPIAIVDDGLLDVCIVTAMPALEFVQLLRRVADGEHLEDPRVRYFRARRVDMRFDRPVKINTDGQVLEVDRCRYEVHPRALRFFVGEAPLAARTDGTSATE